MSTTRPQIIPHVRLGVTIQDNSWMDSVEQVYNSGYYYVPGPYANDSDAATNMVPVGAAYYNFSAQIVVRMV